MRRIGYFALLSLFAGAALLATGPAMAQTTTTTTVPRSQFLSVGVVVQGTAPLDARFVVHVECAPAGGGASTISQDLVFPPFGGMPILSGYDFSALQPGDLCTATETGTAGASSVAYACNQNGQWGGPPCLANGRQAEFSTDPTASENVNLVVTNVFAVVVLPPFTG